MWAIVADLLSLIRDEWKKKYKNIVFSQCNVQQIVDKHENLEKIAWRTQFTQQQTAGCVLRVSLFCVCRNDRCHWYIQVLFFHIYNVAKLLHDIVIYLVVVFSRVCVI